MKRMAPIGFIAVAIGLVFLIALIVVSLRGPRDPGGRLPGNDGPMTPYDDHHIDV